MTQGKNHEIRKIMQKNNLQIGRLIRTKYGPYSIGNWKHGNLIEAPIDKSINKKIYFNMRKKSEKINENNKNLKVLKTENRDKIKLIDQYENLKKIY